MTQLIKEANNDDSFNTQMMKIQDAIEVLEKIVPLMDPLTSQSRALELSSDDLKRLVQQIDLKRPKK